MQCVQSVHAPGLEVVWHRGGGGGGASDARHASVQGMQGMQAAARCSRRRGTDACKLRAAPAHGPDKYGAHYQNFNRHWAR